MVVRNFIVPIKYLGFFSVAIATVLSVQFAWADRGHDACSPTVNNEITLPPKGSIVSEDKWGNHEDISVDAEIFGEDYVRDTCKAPVGFCKCYFRTTTVVWSDCSGLGQASCTNGTNTCAIFRTSPNSPHADCGPNFSGAYCGCDINPDPLKITYRRETDPNYDTAAKCTNANGTPWKKKAPGDADSHGLDSNSCEWVP